MAKQGGKNKRPRTPQESAAQRNRSYKNKQLRRKAHAEKYPNDKTSLANVKRWTIDSQKVQK